MSSKYKVVTLPSEDDAVKCKNMTDSSCRFLYTKELPHSDR
jgi:hypothetical protein